MANARSARWSQVPFATVHHHDEDDIHDVPYRPQIRAPRGRERRIWWTWLGAMVAAVAVCLCLSMRQLSSQTKHLPEGVEAHEEVQQKQEVPPAGSQGGSQGGTLEVGPGCPSACGSFVACTLNVSSQNNNLPLEFWLANISCTFFHSFHFHFPTPFDAKKLGCSEELLQLQGFFPLNPNIEVIVSLTRLFNKQITPFVAWIKFVR